MAEPRRWTYLCRMRAKPFRFEDGLLLIGRDPASTGPARSELAPDWVAANPRKIRDSLRRALAKPSGGWTVLDASRRITETPRAFKVAGQELVAWRAGRELRVAPDSCPHMGARLSCSRVDAQGRIVCPWHGLALGDRPHGSFRTLRSHDDGVLAWVRIPALLMPMETETEAPILAPRPPSALEAVLRVEAKCEPEDVLANRLDPWHGAHFHPHSFARLSVLNEDDESITVRVVYRIAGPLGMEVDARFHCPDPRTIVMTIVNGDGVGSVVETHATPIDQGRTAIIEATLAASERPALSWLPRLRPLLHRAVEARAAKLWRDDVEYCERTAELRRSNHADKRLTVLRRDAYDAE
jgi:Domain of unknown function (DUF5914)/Rieske [2Fe-2S] domain